MPLSQALRLPPSTDPIDPSGHGDLFLGAEPFQYDPLSDSEPQLRLLKLLASDDSYDDLGYTITCELLYTRVSGLPLYRALSYTWGGAADPLHSVMINGRDFKVRDNLWNALKRLQLEEEPMLIWIDAICINQENNYERSEQVRIMKTIYEKAHHVCVWLGPEGDDSPRAVRLLKDFSRCTGSNELLVKRLKHPDIRDDLDALASLYCRPYWNRIWITQELVLASQIWIFCGKDCVSWNTIENVRKLIGEMPTKSEAHQLFYKNTDDWSYSSLAGNRRGPVLIDATREIFRKRPLGLFETVCEYSQREASDPRDMIYGLLGIVHEKESWNVEINYSTPVAKVYTDFAKQMILDLGILNIVLEVNNGGSNMGSLPSWVPDWSKALQGHLTLQPQGKRTYWDASKKTAAQCLFSGEDTILVMEGLKIGCIRSTKSPAHRDTDDELACTIETFLDWLDMTGSVGGDMRESTLALAAVLTVGRYRSRDKLGWVIGALVHWSTKTGQEDSANPRLSDYMQFPPPMSEEEFEAWSEMRIINASNMIRDRCFFLSDSDTFGLAPGFALEGDILCIAFGCVTPLVLRPCEDYYTVIGEAYVHGFMHGEAIELFKKGELKAQKFEVH